VGPQDEDKKSTPYILGVVLFIERKPEMMSDALTNAENLVLGPTICLHSQQYTNDSVF